MATQQLHFSTNIAQTLESVLAECIYDKLFIVTDTNCQKECMPLLQSVTVIQKAVCVVLESGDENKTIEAVQQIWSTLSSHEASRASLVINIGGGMITDLSGFAASTFKRGIRYINIATTILGGVDAAVGGKTGINFNGLKNEVGVFNPAIHVLISSQFVATLSLEHRLAGYAEMLKHALLDGEQTLDQLLIFDIEKATPEQWLEQIARSVRIKEHIVTIDPYEKGIRKALNLGHTVGHAFEALSHKQGAPISHGYAVAYGTLVELYMSHFALQFPLATLRRIEQFIQSYYGSFAGSCKDYDILIELMQHDKKNEGEGINFTLLKEVGNIEINQIASIEEIKTALDFYFNL